MYYAHYHVTWVEPYDLWPEGAWSVYNITGDEIADCIVKDAAGKVAERHPWDGFLGMVSTIDQLGELLEAHKAWVAYANARLPLACKSFDYWARKRLPQY